MSLEKLTRDEFYSLFDQEVHSSIDNVQDVYLDSTHIMVAENLDFCSSSFGDRSALIVGPSNTYKTLKECEGKYIGDLPSTRQYFTKYYEIERNGKL